MFVFAPQKTSHPPPEGCVSHLKILYAANAVNSVQIGRRVRSLIDAQPERYAAAPRATIVRETPPLTEADVTRLVAACRTHTERAFLALVSTTGLRACAIGAARVADVWCAASAQVRDTFTFDEKNSQVRTVWPSAELQTCLSEYLRSGEHPGEHISPFLFPSRRRPRFPSKSVARNLLRAICARIPAQFSPHQFRHCSRRIHMITVIMDGWLCLSLGEYTATSGQSSRARRALVRTSHPASGLHKKGGRHPAPL